MATLAAQFKLLKMKNIALVVMLMMSSFVVTAQLWAEQQMPTPLPGKFNKAEFLNQEIGFIAGSQGYYVRTEDAGATWNYEWVNFDILEFFFLDESNIFRCGDDGRIDKSSDKGVTWQSINVQENGYVVRDVFFTTPNNGYALTYDPENWSFAVYVFKTIDGGQTWQRISLGTTSTVHGFHFVNDTVGFIGAMGGGKILRTVNGGGSWTTIPVAGSSVYSFHFFSDSVGIGVGNEGHVYRTEDAGATWTDDVVCSDCNLTKVDFVDQNNGWVGAWEGGLLKTTNGGLTWEEETINEGVSVVGLDYITKTFGWVPMGQKIFKYGAYTPSEGSKFRGKVFANKEKDCLAANNPGLSNIIVQALPGPFYAITDNNGEYELPVEKGNYIISAILPSSTGLQYKADCTPQYNVVINDDDTDSSGIDFGVDVKFESFLEVSVASTRRRRCFESYTSVTYENKGLDTARDVHVIVEFPDFVQFISSSVTHQKLEDNTYRFDLGNLSPLTAGRFRIQDKIVCGEERIRGLAQCTKATIFPENVFTDTSSVWDQSIILATGSCLFRNFVELKLENKGASMNDSAEYVLYENGEVFFKANYKLAAKDSVKFVFDSKGNTFHIRAEQSTGNPRQRFAVGHIEACDWQYNDEKVIGQINKVSVQDFIAGEDVECLPIIDSYDPNDKKVIPEGVGAGNYVELGTEMNYTIRFQNTGSDTAYKVVIVDTLPAEMDVSSFKARAMSHDGEFSINKTDKFVLEIVFENINLPDSGASQEGSNGFFKFSIKPLANVDSGQVIRNTAEIYFDFNSAIITNTSRFEYGIPDTLKHDDPLVFESFPLTDLEEDTLCVGDSMTFYGYSSAPIWWSYLGSQDTLGRGDSLTLLMNEQKTVVAHDGTSTDSSLILLFEDKRVSLGSDTTICIGQSLTLAVNQYDSVHWGNGSTESNLLVSSEGIYAVRVVDEHECVSKDTVAVSFESCTSVRSVNENTCSVIFNAESGELNIDLIGFRNVDVVITNLNGQIFQQQYYAVGSLLDYQLIGSGVYLLTVNTSEEVYIHKLLKR